MTKSQERGKLHWAELRIHVARDAGTSQGRC